MGYRESSVALRRPLSLVFRLSEGSIPVEVEESRYLSLSSGPRCTGRGAVAVGDHQCARELCDVPDRALEKPGILLPLPDRGEGRRATRWIAGCRRIHSVSGPPRSASSSSGSVLLNWADMWHWRQRSKVKVLGGTPFPRVSAVASSRSGTPAAWLRK